MNRVLSLVLAALFCCAPGVALAKEPANSMTWILETVGTNQASLRVVVYAPGGGIPAGKVEVYMNGVAVGEGKLGKDGTVTCVVSRPPAGVVFTAKYLGDDAFAASMSTPVGWF